MGSAEQFAHLDVLFYAVLPYVALVLFLVVTVQRYRQQSFSYSSLSSQFLENRQHFWGMVPFHYGILFVLFGHLIAFLIPRSILWWNSVPARLYILEVTALTGGMLTLVGFLAMFLRRSSNTRVRKVSTPADWVVYLLLLFQVSTGILVAILHGWGSSWFAASLSPYLWSLFQLNPDIAFVTPMPLLVKLHIINAFTLIAVFPFTRLVHVLVIPNMYLWRRTQVVRWNADRKRIRRTGTEG